MESLITILPKNKGFFKLRELETPLKKHIQLYNRRYVPLWWLNSHATLVEPNIQDFCRRTFRKVA